MKEATGEVSGTVITIVLVGAVLALGVWLFSSKGPARDWIENIFKSTTVCTDFDEDGNCIK